MQRSTRLVLTAAVVVAAMILGGAPAASAAGWTRVTEHPGLNLDNPSVLRTPDGVLHLAYEDRLGSLDNNFRYRALSPSGVWSAPISIADHWAGIAEGSLTMVGGKLVAIWGGQGSTDSADASSSGQAWSATLIGGVWTRSSTPSSTSSLPYASGQVSSAVDATGTPWFTWSTTFGVGLHQGLAAAGSENTNVGPATCCGYGTNLGRDAATGDLYLVYYSNADGATGYWTRRVAPALGDPIKLVGSSSGDSALSRTKRLAAAPRTTGGVFTAYCAQYPSCTTLRVADVSGTSLALRLDGGADAESVWTTAAPLGRLWLSWERGGIVYATRSNKTLTKWGPIQRLGAPAGTQSAWYTYGDAAPGPLDLFANVSGAGGGSTYSWHRRVLPALNVMTAKARISNRGMTIVKFRISDAGDPVRGYVKFRGVARSTTSQGWATFVVPPGARTGRFTATGLATGFVPASTHVTIYRPRR